MIIINSFNEWHEGTQIEPTTVTTFTSQDTSQTGNKYSFGYPYKGYGFDYLEIIKDRFGTQDIPQEGNRITTALMGTDKLSNYPNPFISYTTVVFTTEERKKVRIMVYDLLGNEVATLYDQHVSPGVHEIRWDTGEMEGGIYFLKLTTGSGTVTRKLVCID